MLFFFSQPLKVVSFEGDGYLELTSQSIREDAIFGFAFTSQSPDGVLVLSLPASGGVSDASFSVSLKNGHVVVKVPNQPPFVSENKGYDDALLHTVTIHNTAGR